MRACRRWTAWPPRSRTRRAARAPPGGAGGWALLRARAFLSRGHEVVGVVIAPGVRWPVLSGGALRLGRSGCCRPWPRARREHGRAVSLALQAARVHDTRHGASPGAACAAAQGGPWSAWGTPARRAGLERASPRLLRARRDRAGAARQADKEGALEALKAAAAELTSPEEAEHAKLYVRFASKALEKVGAPQTLTLQRRAAVGPRR